PWAPAGGGTVAEVLRAPVAGDEVRVAVHPLGGQGPAVLMAHATGFHGRVWAPVAAALPGFRCLGVDLRGHGDTPAPPDGDFDWDGFGRDLLAVVDGLGLERPLGVGHSCGATALLLAEAARPGAFGGLWLYEPVVFPVDTPLPRAPEHPMVTRARARRADFASREEAYAYFAGRPLFAASHPEALRAYVEHGLADVAGGGVTLKCRPADEAEVFAAGVANRAYSRLARVACPTTLACGAATDAFGPAVMAVQAARLAHASTVVLEGVGHLGPMEDPVAVAVAVAAAFGG
ncbi:MAG: alpha/beta fold hydrolase, partial [Acidimicrobiales bacterium]